MELCVFGRRLTLESIQLSLRGIICTSSDVHHVLNRKLLKAQAPELDNWLTYRCGTVLHQQDLLRLGFAENTINDPSAHCNLNSYEIKRIALASGKERGWRAGQYYASDQAKGGLSTFWEILFHTIETHIVPIEREPGSPITSDIEEADEGDPGVPSVALVFSAARRAEFMDRLDRWCQNNPGRFFKLTCPGYRESSSKISQYLLVGKPVFRYSPHGECIRSSVANALGALAGSQPSLLMLRKGPIMSKTLGQTGSWLERNMKRYRLQNVSVPRDEETASWIMRQGKGIYIATLCGYDERSETMEHTVVIDADHQLVYESMEKVALRLKKGVLECCVGDSFNLLGVSEVKMLTTQKVGNGKNKNRRITAEVQRQRKKGKTEDKTPMAAKKRKAHKARKISDDDD